MHKIFAKTLFIGKNIIYLPACHSTNEVAEELLRSGKTPEGTVIYAEHQTQGKGQAGNVWVSEPGKNITLSIILKPHFLQVTQQFYLNIIASLTILDLMSGFMTKPLAVKWPNDILCENEKICGILVKNHVRNKKMENTILGIGLNVNQTNFEVEKATSMKSVEGHTFDRKKLTIYLLQVFEKRYLQLKTGKLNQLKEEYLNTMYWLGENHTFHDGNEFSGKIIGIDKAGRLIVQKEDGIKHYDFKQIRYIS